MPSDHRPELTPVASFPQGYFLENLAVRFDGSILVTAFNQKELWYVPAPEAHIVDPVLVHTFDYLASAIVETDPDMFYISTSDAYDTHASSLHRLDLTGWAPGDSVEPQIVLDFDGRARALNGGCLIAPAVLLIADSLAGCIWRVDLPTGESHTATARLWLADPSMDYDPHSALTPVQPGVNGIRYAPSRDELYYTSTAQKLFMRVRVDPRTHEPASAPEFVSGGTMADDFCLDEDADVAYVTTHRENTLDRVRLHGVTDSPREIVVGQPFNDLLVGPTSLAWSRAPGDYGRLTYITTEGGTTAPPPDHKVRPARLLRLKLAPNTSERAPHSAATQREHPRG